MPKALDKAQSYDYTRIEATRRKLRSLGGRDDNRSTTHHDLHGDCTSPAHAYKEARHMVHIDDSGSVDISAISLRVRCRKCPNCLQHARSVWTARGLVETRRAARTWFLTLTVGKTFRGTVPRDNMVKELSSELTKYLKRLRKAGGKFKYLAIFERHEDGVPHIHMLLHETDPSIPITYRVIRSQWKPIGFSVARLILENESKAATYVCKYVNKDGSLTRVRASQKYGDLPDDERKEAINLWLQNMLGLQGQQACTDKPEPTA